MNVSNSDHPCAEGLEDFVTNDELYMNIATLPGNDVFLTGESEDGTHAWGADRSPTFMPGGTYDLAWTRSLRQWQSIQDYARTQRPQLPYPAVPAIDTEWRELGYGQRLIAII